MTNVEIEKEKSEEHHETTECSMLGTIAFVSGLVGGTFSAIFCKMAFDSSSSGLDGELKPFGKPITMLFLMFSGMIPAMFMWGAQQLFRNPKDREVITIRMLILLIIPCVCDLLCTLLLLVAQLYITASMWQMMRGTVIIITALLKKFVLNHKLRVHMWAGVTIITLAMTIVACTSLIGTSDESVAASGKDPRIGVFLVILGCLAQGIQYAFEEKVMAVDSIPPLVVIGMEGIWGTLLTLFFVYPAFYLCPGHDMGSYENPFDSYAMIVNSTQLQGLLIGFVLTVTIYNCLAVYVTHYLSALWRCVLDNFRPITIWGLDLAIFYLIMPGSGYGEAWVLGSWLQLGGLLVLFFGTAVYNGSIMVCDKEHSSLSLGEDTPLQATQKGSGSGSGSISSTVIRTPASMASPSLTRSPLVYGQRKADAAAATTKYTSIPQRYAEA